MRCEAFALVGLTLVSCVQASFVGHVARKAQFEFQLSSGVHVLCTRKYENKWWSKRTELDRQDTPEDCGKSAFESGLCSNVVQMDFFEDEPGQIDYTYKNKCKCAPATGSAGDLWDGNSDVFECAESSPAPTDAPTSAPSNAVTPVPPSTAAPVAPSTQATDPCEGLTPGSFQAMMAGCTPAPPVGPFDECTSYTFTCMMVGQNCVDPDHDVLGDWQCCCQGSSHCGVAGPAAECMPTEAPTTGPHKEPSVAPLSTSDVDSILSTHIGDCAIGFTVSGFPETLEGYYKWELNGHYSPTNHIVQGKRALMKVQDGSGYELDASKQRLIYWCASARKGAGWWVIAPGSDLANAQNVPGFCNGVADNGDSADPSNLIESSNIWWYHDGANWQQLESGTVQFICEDPRVDECGPHGYNCWFADQYCFDDHPQTTDDWECRCKEGHLAVWSNGQGQVYSAGSAVGKPAECGFVDQVPNSAPCSEASTCCGCVESGCSAMHYSVGTSLEHPCEWWPAEHAPDGIAGCYHSGHSEYGGHVKCTPQTAPYPTLAPTKVNTDPCAGLNDFQRLMQGCPPVDPCAGLNEFQKLMQGCPLEPPPTTTEETTTTTEGSSCPSDCLGGSGNVRIERCDACKCSECAPDLFNHNCNSNVPAACTMPPKPAACPNTCTGGAGYVRIEMCGDCICAECTGLFDTNCEGKAPPACSEPPTTASPSTPTTPPKQDACATGGFTVAPTGGTCYFDQSRNDCAICRSVNGVKGCPCGIFKQGTASYIHQCVRCQGQHPDPNLQGVETWKHCGEIPKDENDNDCTGLTAYPATLFPSSTPCSGFGGIGNGNHPVCCPTSCGACGGHDCAKLPGGADACCEGPIKASEKFCGAHNAPCILSDSVDASRRSDLLNQDKVPAWVQSTIGESVPKARAQPQLARLRGAVKK